MPNLMTSPDPSRLAREWSRLGDSETSSGTIWAGPTTMVGTIPPFPPATADGFHAQIISRTREVSWSNGWTAEMKIKIPGCESGAFIDAYMMTPFPGTKILRPQRVREEMIEGSPLALDGTPDWVIQTWTYGLDYLDFPFPDDIPRPLYLPGTTLKLKVKYSGQFLCLPSKAFATDKPATNPDGSPHTGAQPSLPPGSNSRILIPIFDYTLEWDRVPVQGNVLYLPAPSSSGGPFGAWQSNIPFLALTATGGSFHLGYDPLDPSSSGTTVPGGSNLQFGPYDGAVNSVPFLGCDPETLLFEGAEVEPSFLMTAKEPPEADPRCYKATVTLKRRRIVVGNDVFGWNHEYDCRGKKWAYVYMNAPGDFGTGQSSSSGTPPGTPRYQLVDFEGMFNGGLFAGSSSGATGGMDDGSAANLD